MAAEYTVTVVITWEQFSYETGLPANVAFSITIDPSGYVWAGGAGVMGVYADNIWLTFTTSDGLQDGYIFSLSSDPNNVIWAGDQYGGVSKFDGSTWTTILDENINSFYLRVAKGRLETIIDSQIEYLDSGRISEYADFDFGQVCSEIDWD